MLVSDSRRDSPRRRGKVRAEVLFAVVRSEHRLASCVLMRNDTMRIDCQVGKLVG